MRDIWDIASEVAGMAEDEAEKHIENFIKEDEPEFIKRADQLLAGTYRIAFREAVNIMAKRISEERHGRG